MEDFSRTAKPLYDRTQKKYDGKWEWTDKEQHTFDELRRKLTMAPVMVHLNAKAPRKIEMDAARYICSGKLAQQCKGIKWRPVANQSKTMQDAECNYHIHTKELVAIIQAFKEWKSYTRRSPRPVRVFTDHKNLVTFISTKELRDQQGTSAKGKSAFAESVPRQGAPNLFGPSGAPVASGGCLHCNSPPTFFW